MTPDAYPDDPCLTPPAICDPRVRFFHDEGILFVTAAPPPPGTSPPDSFVAVWRDHGDAKPYVFDRRIYTYTDLGHALLRLETILGVNRAQFTSNSSLLNDAVTLALAAPPDATDWPLATHGAIAVALDFDSVDISDPTFLLADDDHGGDLDSEDECHNNSFTTGLDDDYEFAPTELLTLDDLAIELTYGVDCCGTSDCCDNNSQCGQNEHCADGDCVPDECNGPEDCPEGSHCEGGECVDDACVLPTDCPPNMECLGGQCETPCNGNGDCPTGEECVGGVCENCPGVCCDNSDCGDISYCTIDECRDGGCYHRYKNCSDGDKCTDDYCNPETGQCEHVANYDDDNPCTLDQCDPETGAATHTCMDECTTCDDGFCVSCSCEEPGCSVQLDIEPQQVCSGGIVELTLTAECHPDCGDGALQFHTDPVDAEFTWFEPPPESIECDGQPHVLFLRARASCEERGFVTFIVELESPGDQNCTDDALTEVIQCPDVDMDANRDGVVTDSDDDEEGEDAWQYGAAAKGAIVLVNCDADGATPPARDLDDNIVNGPNDEADLSEMRVRAVAGPYMDGWNRRMTVSGGNVALRVFRKEPSGTWTLLFGPGQPVHYLPLPISEELHLGVEAVYYPGDKDHDSFTGLVRIDVDLLDEQYSLVCNDNLQLRVAPFVMLPNTAPPHQVLVTDDDAGFASFVQTRAGSVNTRVIDHAACNDRWTQDAWEFGFSSRPLSENTWRLWTGFETIRAFKPLQSWGRACLLGSVDNSPGDCTGLVFRLLDGDNGRAYGGNLELIPPYGDYPLGRVAVGTMPSDQVTFLNRQEVQGPVVQFDTTWLAAGHIDEFMAFIPDPSGFAAAFASPVVAKQILDAAPEHEPLFYGNATDGVITGQASGGTTTTLVDSDTQVDFTTKIGWYVRIYASNPTKGRNQIAVVGPQSSADTISIVGVDVWHFPTSYTLYGAIFGNPISRRSHGSWHAGAGVPDSSSKYVLVPATKSWVSTFSMMEFPALTTAVEMRLDQSLWMGMNWPADTHIDDARNSLLTALNGHPAPILEVPVVYFGLIAPSLTLTTAVAYVPGAANLQVWDEQLWLAQPYGPRDPVTREDLFARATMNALNSPGVRATYFVGDWDRYHRNWGEVHCGTNVIRTPPNSEFAQWWRFEP